MDLHGDKIARGCAAGKRFLPLFAAAVVASMSFGAERMFCDLGAALDESDHTNGGFWTIDNRADAIVFDATRQTSSSAVIAPGSAGASIGRNLNTAAPSGYAVILR